MKILFFSALRPSNVCNRLSACGVKVGFPTDVEWELLFTQFTGFG